MNSKRVFAYILCENSFLLDKENLPQAYAAAGVFYVLGCFLRPDQTRMMI